MADSYQEEIVLAQITVKCKFYLNRCQGYLQGTWSLGVHITLWKEIWVNVQEEKPILFREIACHGKLWSWTGETERVSSVQAQPHKLQKQHCMFWSVDFLSSDCKDFFFFFLKFNTLSEIISSSGSPPFRDVYR